jgi:hypothetical protein
MAVSVSSDSRRTVGSGPSCASARTAREPAANDGNDQPVYERASGSGRTRRVSSVITPKAPSEPSSSCRRSGPAADLGARPISRSPVGVATRRPSTISSKRPFPADAWPLERVAAKPPRLAYRNDCGKWPRVRPAAASSSSARGPRTPACSVAVRETWSTRSSASSRERSRATTPAYPPASGRRPPTTDVPPPNGTTATRCRAAARSTAATSACPAGRSTASGASAAEPPRRRSRSSVDLPAACARRAASPVSTSAHAVSNTWTTSADSRTGGGTGRATAGRGSRTPSAAPSSSWISPGRVTASAGSPHRAENSMRYTVTHVVTT